MNTIKKLLILAVAGFGAVSCDSYFDVQLDDQATIDQIFQENIFTHRYLAQLYSWIPLDEEFVGSEGAWGVARSDEATFNWYTGVNFNYYKSGNYGSSTPSSEAYFNYWTKYYKAINECSVFIAYVDNDKEDSPEVRAQMKGEARFLRAFYYFCLFRMYGPVYLWGDEPSDRELKGEDVDRNTLEENIEWMVSELDKAIEDLPRLVSDNGEAAGQYTGRATKGAAMALKARILTYAASPLYNGCPYYVGRIQNKKGQYLFPQEEDPTKWQKAADACKDVIDLELYQLATAEDLYKARTDIAQAAPGTQQYYIHSAQATQFAKWNSPETIFGWWKRTSAAYSWLGTAVSAVTTTCPPGSLYYAYGNAGASLKLVDTYPMAESGRYPVTGYEKVAGLNDWSKPIVDELSGYQTQGFTEDYKQPDAPWAAPIKAHNTTVGRDARYYADILPNGYWFPNSTNKVKWCIWNNPDAVLATEKWSAAGDQVRSGYVCRKFYPTDWPFNTPGATYTSYTEVFPAFRLAEVYLEYAEACNELGDYANAALYINKVRNRVGLNNIEDAYPGIIGNKELMRWCIQREYMVEFAFEAHRHYDACRWMIAMDEYPAEPWSLRLSADTYEETYERTSTDIALRASRFTEKDYLFPLSSKELSNMVNITQNYGF